MKQLILIISLFIVSNTFGQNKLDRVKAEASVTKYMTTANKNYKGLSFGEFFEQTYPKEVQDKLKTKRVVKYSLVHTYTIGAKKVIDMYFHLDEKYEVVGKLTMSEMDGILRDLENKSGKLDSIMNSLIPDSAPSH
jgi:outer membrane receptor for Fe3+-dicitrate